MKESKSKRSLARGSRLGYLAMPLLAACALTSKGEPLTPRYFTALADPGVSTPAPSSPGPEPAASELRIGRVESAAHLEERITYRVSDAELAYYADRRWTEPPEELVRRSVEHELFERRGLSRVVSGAAPTLDIEVLGFEELREKPVRARVSLFVMLHDDRRSQLERTFTVDVPVAAGSDSGPALARAMASALSGATRQLADAAVAELGEHPGSVAAARR